ncbi:MAG: AraC family transcriptional regulator, partial [Bacteroidota bacterium]
MKEEIPKIHYKNKRTDIEVMSFKQLYYKLEQAKDHDPFAVHKIQFFLILIVTQDTYAHFVDFKSYQLRAGSVLFVAKNQVHHFSKTLQQAAGIGIIFSSLFVDKHFFLSDTFQLNRLFNYHIETPLIHLKEMGDHGFMTIANQLLEEYALANPFAKVEILGALLQVLLLKAERVKEDQSVRGVKKHWLDTFCRFRDLLEEEYVNTRSSRVYAAKL